MASADRAPAPLAIEVAYSPAPGQVDLVTLQVPPGTTADQAVSASGLLTRHVLPAAGLRLGIWGQLKEATQVLRERDRVEIYRPLRVDPKEARRQRYQRHKDRLAGKVGPGG
jgi:putative ubiquitin-RnfH superfamily antitoxin RatB of RatAB toxin-antitoxin module